MTSLRDFLSGMMDGSGSESEKTLVQKIQDRSDLSKKRLEIDRKLLALINEIGAAKVERLVALLQGTDPDEPVIIGKHGPGCTCPINDDESVSPFN